VRDGFVLFWKPPSVFGQWTPSAFEVQGQRCGIPLPAAPPPLGALPLALVCAQGLCAGSAVTCPLAPLSARCQIHVRGAVYDG
jgi:hypothetical protein